MPRPERPRLRAGRHLRRAALELAGAVLLAVPLALALVRLAPAWAQWLGAAAALAAVALGVLRLRAARRSDAGEERWLRGVLDGLDDGAIDDGDRLDFNRP